MIKCVTGIGLEENSSRKYVVMLRFVLGAYYMVDKSRSDLLECWVVVILLCRVWLANYEA